MSPRLPAGATIEQRLRFRMVEAPSGCWIWLGYCTRAQSGEQYARIQVGGKSRMASRISYELFVGPIPEGYQVDHLCRRTRCVRPAHLQAVSAQVNVLRGTSPGARAQRRDACLRGHAYAEHAKVWRGRTYCRACQRLNMQAYLARQRAKRTATPMLETVERIAA